MTTVIRKISGWSVHAFTASSVVFALFALQAIEQNNMKLLFLLLLITTVIDAVDGTLARKVNVQVNAPQIDGALLDNIVDYITYVLIPCYFLLRNDAMLPMGTREFVSSAIMLASAYQFCQRDAKTEDHFFKGFPSYWNILVILLYAIGFSPLANLLILLSFVILVFVPIKYVYPSRMQYFSNSAAIRRVYMALTILFGVAVLGTIYSSSLIFTSYMIAYTIFYFATSIYRTLVPLQKK